MFILPRGWKKASIKHRRDYLTWLVSAAVTPDGLLEEGEATLPLVSRNEILEMVRGLAKTALAASKIETSELRKMLEPFKARTFRDLNEDQLLDVGAQISKCL